MILLTIGASLLLAAALILTFFGYGWTALIAFVALWISGASGSALVIWGATAVLVWGLTLILPPAVAGSRRGVAYIVGASAAGTAVGLFAGAGGIVAGAVIGAVCGGLAYGSTPDGRQLGFPSREFFNYIAAKAFPAAITVALIGETAVRLLP